MTKIHFSRKQIALSLVLSFLLTALAVNIRIVKAEWREPNSSPPSGGIAAPISTGPDNQAKAGSLLLDSAYIPGDPVNMGQALKVLGAGAQISEVEANDLTVANMLYINSDKVGIGTNNLDNILTVVGGQVKVTAGNNQAVSAYSSGGHGISGVASAIEMAGIYGLANSESGYGVYGSSTSGYGVYGSSASGYGVYGLTNSIDQAAVYGQNTGRGWAGYFKGRLETGSDVVGLRFTPTALQRSIVPFTAGQEVGAGYGLGFSSPPAKISLAFDGTYIWAATSSLNSNNKSLFKVRAADGAVVGSYNPGNANFTFSDVIFDGRYLWLIPIGQRIVIWFRPEDSGGGSINPSGPIFNINDSLIISSYLDDQSYAYVWATKSTADASGNYSIIKIKAADSPSFEIIPIYKMKPLGLAFDGTYIWAAAHNMDDQRDYLVKRSLSGDVNISYRVDDDDCKLPNVFFDGLHIWCLTDDSNSIGENLLRVWPADPDDLGHPIEQFGVDGKYQEMAFDGTYIWTARIKAGNNKLYQLKAADPSESKAFPLNYTPSGLAFDGTYIWAADVTSAQSQLHRYYSGTGMGQTNLTSIVALDPLARQSGSIGISGSAAIGDQADDSLTVTGDLEAAGNDWQAGTEEVERVSSGLADCSNGKFIKGINIDANQQLVSILCQGF